MGNEYLKRQCTTTGDRSVWTWAGWVKNQNHLATSGIFGGYYSNSDSNFIEHLWTSVNNEIDGNQDKHINKHINITRAMEIPEIYMKLEETKANL